MQAKSHSVAARSSGASRAALLFALLAGLGCDPQGCDPPPPMDGGVDAMPDAMADAMPDAPVDGALDAGDAGAPDAGDAGVDGGDGGFDAGDDATTDGGIDAGDGGGPDAGSCPDGCPPPSSCLVGACVDGACAFDPSPDGASCGPGGEGSCAGGTCVVAGCGDGVREVGPEPAREGCDDGNDLPDDACAPGCTPAVVVVSSRAAGEDWPAGPAASAGVDGLGQTLFVWQALTLADPSLAGSEPTQAVHARGYDEMGVPLLEADTPLILDGDVGAGWDAEPTVAGLRDGGWVVAWTAPERDGDLGSIAYRVIAPDLTVGDVVVLGGAAIGQQHGPRVAAFDDGFALVYRDESPAILDGPPSHSQVVLHVDATAATCAGGVVSSRGADHGQPAIATKADGLLVVWTDGGALPPLLDEVPRIVGRRYDAGGCSVDGSPFFISDPAPAPVPLGDVASAAFEGGVAALAGGDYAVAWVDRSFDARGDIRVTRVSATGAPLDGTGSMLVAAEPLTAERLPSLAPAPGGGFVVAYQRSAIGRDVLRDVVLLSVGFPLAPEAPLLADHLSVDGLEQDAAIVASPTGFWVTWSDDGALGDADAFRSFLAYHLPLD